MNENEYSTHEDLARDDAPDLSGGGWPEKFANATVRRGRPPTCQTESVNHHTPFAGRDHSLQDGWSRLADSDRPCPS